MHIKRFGFLLLLLLVMSPSLSAQQISHEELVEILGIKSWRVPTPKNDNRQWSIRIVDYAPRKFTDSFNTEQLDAQQKALIVLRDIGKNVYEFTLKQRSGMSQGEVEIKLCPANLPKEDVCDTSTAIEWFDVPKPFDDGTKFVIAEIRQMVQGKYNKQIVLELAKIRLE